VAIARLVHEGRIVRAVVIDLDVHQGNGTAAIFEQDEDVYTFSMHGERNYPTRKMRSSLDVPLADGTGDEEYLTMLKTSLPRVMAESRADIAYYVAGVDVAAGDRYGRLTLSDAGIAARDSFVVETVRAANVPLVITLGGGYALSRERTAELHVHVFRACVARERAAEAKPP
jgi:acetoin utilization deacetylase AcuC-like enzyme